VLAALREAAVPRSIRALASDTGLSANALRFHLDHLLQAGAVRSVRDADHIGAGRPATLYSALPAEGVDDDAAYRALAGRLATQLVRAGGPRASTDAGRAWAKELLEGRDVAGRDTRDVVMSILEDGGFSPLLSTDGDTVELRRCPFLDLALQQPAVVCGVHLGLLSGVLDLLGAVSSVQLVPALEDDGPCLVRLHLLDPADSYPVERPTIEENAS